MLHALPYIRKEGQAHATRSTLYKKRRACSCYTLYLIEETKSKLMLHALPYLRNEGQANATRSSLYKKGREAHATRSLVLGRPPISAVWY